MTYDIQNRLQAEVKRGHKSNKFKVFWLLMIGYSYSKIAFKKSNLNKTKQISLNNHNSVKNIDNRRKLTHNPIL